jgi:hypothetical protein
MRTFFDALKYLVVLRWKVWRGQRQAKLAH